ncbi:hypothetical protein SRHO_G00029300 [Serrasalmus rhombeus]
MARGGRWGVFKPADAPARPGPALIGPTPDYVHLLGNNLFEAFWAAAAAAAVIGVTLCDPSASAGWQLSAPPAKGPIACLRQEAGLGGAPVAAGKGGVASCGAAGWNPPSCVRDWLESRNDACI